MSEPWVVLKFGGTSVAGRSQWDTIAHLVRARRGAGYRVLVVCSALEGITDALVELADSGQAHAGVDWIMERHARLAASLGVEDGAILDEGRCLIEAALEAHRARPGPPNRAALLATGEWLSTRLGAEFLGTQFTAAWVDARDALEASPEPDPNSPRAWLSASCDAYADERLQADWSRYAAVLVTQGFVLQSPDGGTALLGRGGSDTSAALLASRLGAERVEIWTDVNGLYSADPRLEPSARLIDSLSYSEALEMAAGGARVIHARSIRAAAAVGIPLQISNLGEPERGGTLISGDTPNAPEGIRAVICQSGMAVLLLENLDTRQQVGFLAGVFGTIAGHGVSVDLVATSETTTTLAIDCAANHLDGHALASLAEALAGLCRVEIHADCACVNLVGRGARTALARLGATEEFFADHRLLMMSHSANDLSISMLVHAVDARPLARLLHGALVLRS